MRRVVVTGMGAVSCLGAGRAALFDGLRAGRAGFRPMDDFGALGMRYDKSKLLAGIYLIRTLSIAAFLLLPVSPGATLVFASVMGFFWLGVAPLVSGLIGGMFGMRHFNMLYGVVFLGHQVGSFAGAWMGGAVIAAGYGYRAPSLAGAGLSVLGLVVLGASLLLHRRTSSPSRS